MREKIRLGDVCTVVTGSTPKTGIPDYWNGDIDWITPAELNEETYIINGSERKITELAVRKTGLKSFPKGTVVLSSRAPIGKVGIAGKEMYCNQGFKNLICGPRIYNEYLYWFLKSRKEYLISLGRGATFKEISKKIVESVEINLPSLSTQKEIVDILNKCRHIVDIKREELRTIDLLLNARFSELFGDPVFNEKGWKVSTVKDLCKAIYGGGTPSKSHPEYYLDGNIPWVSSKDMKTNLLNDSQIKINQLGIENSTTRLVPVNSVIMVIRSGILKHTLPVAVNLIPITINQDLKAFIPNQYILSRFMAIQFQLQEKDILSQVRAVTADNIEFKSILSRKMIVPPIDLQSEYVNFLTQIDKSKFTISKYL